MVALAEEKIKKIGKAIGPVIDNYMKDIETEKFSRGPNGRAVEVCARAREGTKTVEALPTLVFKALATELEAGVYKVQSCRPVSFNTIITPSSLSRACFKPFQKGLERCAKLVSSCPKHY